MFFKFVVMRGFYFPRLLANQETLGTSLWVCHATFVGSKRLRDETIHQKLKAPKGLIVIRHKRY